MNISMDYERLENKIVSIQMEIPLNKGKVAIIDAEDYDKVKDCHWFVHSNKSGQFYATAKKMKNRISTQYWMHHLIMGERTEVDHKNGNGLDNRKENLRKCTRSQNNMNHIPKRGNHTSFFKGVGLIKKTGRWRAFIGTKHLGVFALEIEAAKAYNDAAKKYYGEFARLNGLPTA